MANLLTAPITQFVDENGSPLASGKVYTYVTGASLTPKATYTDSSATTPLSNPVILDSNGSAEIWLSGAYRIRVADADDVLIWDVDDVDTAGGGGGGGGGSTFLDNAFQIINSVDATKIATFDCAGITTGNTRVITVPDSDITLVGTSNAQTLTNKTLTDATVVFADEADSTKRMAFQLSGITTATTRTVTMPDKSGTLAMTSDVTTGTVTSVATSGGITGGTITTSGTVSIDTNNTSGVGGYSLMLNQSGVTINSGSTAAASDLEFAGGSSSGWVAAGTPTGTWRNVGGYNIPANNYGIFIRTA